MREITSHKMNGLSGGLQNIGADGPGHGVTYRHYTLNEDLQIIATDEPGHGGAHHHYAINYCLNPGTAEGGVAHLAEIKFQNGPVQEFGINGVSNEALLAIVEDRLACFQAGDYRCYANTVALLNVQEALLWLQRRTRGRLARGVEGLRQK